MFPWYKTYVFPDVLLFIICITCLPWTLMYSSLKDKKVVLQETLPEKCHLWFCSWHITPLCDQKVKSIWRKTCSYIRSCSGFMSSKNKENIPFHKTLWHKTVLNVLLYKLFPMLLTLLQRSYTLISYPEKSWQLHIYTYNYKPNGP